MRLSHSDWSQVSVFLEELYAQTETGAFRKTVLTGLKKLIACEHTSYNEIDARTNGAVILMHPWVPEVYQLSPSLEAHFFEHPQIQYYRQSADRQIYQTTDFFSLRQFREKGIYQEFYRHVDTEHQLVCILSEQGAAEDIGIGLNRKLKQFSERDRAVLNHLRPHLNRARLNAVAITTAVNRGQALTGALDTMQAGLALVNSAGCVTWATPQVARWLEVYFPLSRTNPNRLPEDLERWLQTQQSSLIKGTVLTKAPVAFIVHHQHSTLTVRFQSVVEGSLRLIFSEKCELLTVDRARELGLTAREAEVLHWIGEGKSNPEIALILSISCRTVHKHVEHILAKLGVETRFAAVREVSAD